MWVASAPLRARIRLEAKSLGVSPVRAMSRPRSQLWPPSREKYISSPVAVVTKRKLSLVEPRWVTVS